jgi:hypothetical protein
LSLYLLLLVPTLLCLPWGWRLSRTQIVAIWVMTTPIIAWLMPIGSRDFSIYLENFADYARSSFRDLPFQDPLYSTLAWSWAALGGSGEAFYIALSSLALLITLFAFRKLTALSALATLLHMTSYFFLHEFTQLRAALAIAIWMHALAEIDRNSRRYVLLTLFAATIHIQALLGLIVLPILQLTRASEGRRIFLLSATVILALAPLHVFDAIGFAVISRVPDPRAAIYLAFAEEGIWQRPNPFSAISMIAYATGALGLLRLAPFDARPETPPMRAVYTGLIIGSASLSLFSAITVGAFRISEHFFALLPVGVAMLAYQFRARALVLPGVLALAGLQLYIFLFYAPFLLNPLTGEPNG